MALVRCDGGPSRRPSTIVAGPYQRDASGQVRADPGSSCHDALRWLDAVLAAR